MFPEQLPYSLAYVNTSEPIEGKNLMEFRLLYAGELLSSGNHPKPENKHKIRKALHPQLRNLWLTKGNLRQYAAFVGNETPPHGGTEEEKFERGIVSIGKHWERGGFHFVPIVTDKFALRCSVDILLLRPHEKQIIQPDTSDLDGKVKTIFDALQIPESAGSLSPVEEGENPFFVLLSNDNLISQVRVTADQLLALPGQQQPKASDSYVLVHIKINHIGGGPFDRWFE
jgi:hypothetical protein